MHFGVQRTAGISSASAREGWNVRNWCSMENSDTVKFMNNKEDVFPISQSACLAFQNAIKHGVYKELYKKQMLTSQQLNTLLAQIK